jgi:hypothetical protein
VEEVATKVMQVDKEVELFQTMVIVSQNMGNLNLEVNNLKNILATKKGSIARGIGQGEGLLEGVQAQYKNMEEQHDKKTNLLSGSITNGYICDCSSPFVIMVSIYYCS